MSVKGPRLWRMQVQAQRPGRVQVNVVAVFALLAVACVVAYYGGRYMTLRVLADYGDQNRLPKLEALLDENTGLRDELAVLRGGGEVSRQVEERVRTANRELQDRVAELEEAIAYYRRVDAPNIDGKGLRIESLKVAAAKAPQVWTLRLLLVRTGETDGHVEGRLEGTLLARGATGQVELPLAQLLPVDQQRFRVRYVEDRSVEFRLPAGLSPVRLDAVVVLGAPREGRISKSWQRQVVKSQREVATDVGQQEQ